MDNSGTYGAECSRKVASGRRVIGAIRSPVNARDLHLESARLLQEILLLTVLIYGSGNSRKYLELGLYRWTTSEDC